LIKGPGLILEVELDPVLFFPHETDGVEGQLSGLVGLPGPLRKEPGQALVVEGVPFFLFFRVDQPEPLAFPGVRPVPEPGAFVDPARRNLQVVDFFGQVPGKKGLGTPVFFFRDRPFPSGKGDAGDDPGRSSNASASFFHLPGLGWEPHFPHPQQFTREAAANPALLASMVIPIHGWKRKPPMSPPRRPAEEGVPCSPWLLPPLLGIWKEE